MSRYLALDHIPELLTPIGRRARQAIGVMRRDRARDGVIRRGWVSGATVVFGSVVEPAVDVFFERVPTAWRCSLVVLGVAVSTMYRPRKAILRT